MIRGLCPACPAPIFLQCLLQLHSQELFCGSRVYLRKQAFFIQKLVKIRTDAGITYLYHSSFAYGKNLLNGG